MTRARIIAALLACAAMAGCKSTQPAAPVTLTNTDSTRVEVSYREIMIRDTVLVALPAQSAERTARDSVSRLETDYATSLARINADGTLTHTLSTKPQPIPVAVDTKATERDSVIIRNRTIEVPAPYAVEVERKLTTMQKFSIRGFWVLLAICIALAAYRWRRPIIKVVNAVSKFISL